MTARGRFLSIEGGEGVGKSTQINALADMIRNHGHEVILTREPGGTEGAEIIRQLLLGGSAERWLPRAEALLFAAARSDHVERLIEPALASGKWVIADRFIDSSRAYQGAGSGMSDDDIMTLHNIGSRGLLPDRTLVLRLDPKEAAQRAAARERGAAGHHRLEHVVHQVFGQHRVVELALGKADQIAAVAHHLGPADGTHVGR